MDVPQNLKIEPPYDPAIPLLGTYLDKTLTQKDTCTPMFTAALFTTAMTWKQPKCPLTGERIKMWNIYTMEYYSATKKNEIMPFAATRMDLEIVILSEVRSDRERQTLYDITYMWNLKCRTNGPIYKPKQTCGCQGVGGEAGEGWTGSLGLVDANYYV